MNKLVYPISLAALARSIAASEGISLRDAQLKATRSFAAVAAQRAAEGKDPEAPPARQPKTLAALAREIQAKSGVSMEHAQRLAVRMLAAARAQ